MFETRISCPATVELSLIRRYGINSGIKQASIKEIINNNDTRHSCSGGARVGVVRPKQANAENLSFSVLSAARNSHIVKKLETFYKSRAVPPCLSSEPTRVSFIPRFVFLPTTETRGLVFAEKRNTRNRTAHRTTIKECAGIVGAVVTNKSSRLGFVNILLFEMYKSLPQFIDDIKSISAAEHVRRYPGLIGIFSQDLTDDFIRTGNRLI